MSTPPNTQNSSIPWYQQPADRPKTNKTFFCYKEHVQMLDRDYRGSSSALVRFLLDKFFNSLEMQQEFKDADSKK
jgi:hypothetical protein